MTWLPLALRRFLRSPRVIVGEVAGIALGGLAIATVPQTGAREAASQAAGGLVSVLALDRVTQAPWFLALVLLAAASLSLVVVEQMKRAWRVSRRPMAGITAGLAPYRRQAVFAAGTLPAGPAQEIRLGGRLGIWGSPLFHSGLLVVVAAGLIRMLFGAEAAVDLIVGETLAPADAQYAIQRPGLLARPFAFPDAVRLDALRVARYPSGGTQSVDGTVTVGDGPTAVARAIAINAPLRKGIHSLYISGRGGAAALVEVTHAGSTERRAILLRESATGADGTMLLADGTLLRASADRGGVGRVPEEIELRALRGGALAGLGTLRSGSALTLPEGTRVTLVAVVPWVGIAGQRDASTPLVYLGFLLISLGGLLIFAVVPVESAVLREPVAAGVRLTVMMRPRRFVPIFSPAFEDLWRRSTTGPSC